MRGYTLVELMMVVAIVGVVIAIGTMNFVAQMPHDNLRHAALKVVSDLRFARQTAITKGRDETITFSSGTYVLPKYVRFGLSSNVTQSTSPKKKDWTPPADGVSFDGGKATFKPNGVIKKFGTVYLTNIPPGNETRAITVNSTGRVKAFYWNENKKDWE